MLLPIGHSYRQISLLQKCFSVLISLFQKCLIQIATTSPSYPLRNPPLTKRQIAIITLFSAETLDIMIVSAGYKGVFALYPAEM